MNNIYKKLDDALSHPPIDCEKSNDNHPGHPQKPERMITIIINGVEKELPKETKELSYEEIVKLAFGEYDGNSSTIYTVVYSKGHPGNLKGTLVKGKSVKVKDGMVINVGKSTKS